MMQYFDPARRAVAVTPSPVAVKVPTQETPSGYFDPSKPRLKRSPYPTAQEIAALVASFDAVTLRAVEGLKAPGETVLAWATRRIGWRKRCACGAIGGGEFGHRANCQEWREWRFGFDNWWWRRRRADDGTEEVEPEDVR